MLQALDGELWIIEPGEHEHGELRVPIESPRQKVYALHAGKLDV